ncbi:MAG TPA: tetratricopeptide repeat protein [Chiayiivirga sp.]|nr:tetratricopeptide repeat protein [Chiayiivirga sp.]
MTGTIPWLRTSVVLVASLLSACTPPAPTRPEPVEPIAPPRDLIAEVRAAGRDAIDGIDIQAFQDPIITDLRDTALKQEHEYLYREADATVQHALSLTPDDPELLQWRAELALAMGHLDDAVRLANASWERGPRLGSLCRRNWAAIRLARELNALPDAAAVAAAQGERCTVAPPIRM